jgi:hypothetical protein
MKTGLELVMEAVDACTDCRKYNGALAVEVLKRALAEEGVATSGRDSYVRSLDIEWDLLVLAEGAKPAFNLLFEVEQGKVALEVKISGVVSEATAITRHNFEVARAAGIKCCYVSFCDRQKAAATNELLGFPSFNLTWSHGPKKPREDTNQWPSLVKFLRALPGPISP